MNNLILFFNSFMSYFLLLLLIAAIVGVAIFIGLKLRKSKNENEKDVQDSVQTPYKCSANEHFFYTIRA